MKDIQASVIIVSFNTKGLLKRCFDSVKASAGDLSYEIIVVDNASKDGSAEYIRSEFPEVILIESNENLGFGGANNLGFQKARGNYTVILNTDAFFVGQSFKTAVTMMEANPSVGLAGGKLVGEDGVLQPAARSFPSVFNEFLILSGLSTNTKNPILGRPNFSFKDPVKEFSCDWITGAFSIIRKPILDKVGFFDPDFFLYFEEVELCRRIKKAGWKIMYWPGIEVIHLGGASTQVFDEKLVSKSGKQMGLWRLQSQYIFHRKCYGGLSSWLSKTLEKTLNIVRRWKNKKTDSQKVAESQVLLELIDRAWSNTKGGRISPPRPWQGF